MTRHSHENLSFTVRIWLFNGQCMNYPKRVNFKAPLHIHVQLTWWGKPRLYISTLKIINMQNYRFRPWARPLKNAFPFLKSGGNRIWQPYMTTCPGRFRRLFSMKCAGRKLGINAIHDLVNITWHSWQIWRGRHLQTLSEFRLVYIWVFYLSSSATDGWDGICNFAQLKCAFLELWIHTG